MRSVAFLFAVAGCAPAEVFVDRPPGDYRAEIFIVDRGVTRDIFALDLEGSEPLIVPDVPPDGQLTAMMYRSSLAELRLEPGRLVATPPGDEGYALPVAADTYVRAPEGTWTTAAPIELRVASRFRVVSCGSFRSVAEYPLRGTFASAFTRSSTRAVVVSSSGVLEVGLGAGAVWSTFPHELASAAIGPEGRVWLSSYRFIYALGRDGRLERPPGLAHALAVWGRHNLAVAVHSSSRLFLLPLWNGELGVFDPRRSTISVTELASPPPPSPFDTFFFGGRDELFYISAELRALLRFDGAAFVSEDPPSKPNVSFNAFTYVPVLDAMVLGTGGGRVYARNDPTRWVEIERPFQAPVRAIAPYPDGFLLGAGASVEQFVTGVGFCPRPTLVRPHAEVQGLVQLTGGFVVVWASDANEDASSVSVFEEAPPE